MASWATSVAERTPRSLVALSVSAVAAIYVAGFVSTQAADTSLSGSVTSAPAAVTAPVVPNRGLAPSVAPTPATPRGTTQPASTAATRTGYRDGTYRGTGTSRRGNVSVSLTVQGGKISNVSITGATTQYPLSSIARLPDQVVSRQSAQVDRVSGATFSAMAFQGAVQQALAQAQSTQAGTTAQSSSSGAAARAAPGGSGTQPSPPPEGLQSAPRQRSAPAPRSGERRGFDRRSDGD